MPVSGSLYIFLHGLTVASDRGKDIQIVLPRVPGHVHKAGGWLAETAIGSEKVLRLQGVEAGSQSFSDPGIAHCMLSLPGTSVTNKARAATIILPRAHAILPLLIARNDHPKYVARTRRGDKFFHQLATVQVLIYAYADENEVYLEGHYWEPAPMGKAMSLHIISTSEEPEGKEHEDMTEDVMHDVLRDYPGIEYFKPRVLGAPWMDPANSDFGNLSPLMVEGQDAVVAPATSTTGGRRAFTLAELEHPTSRALRLSHLARLVQGKRPIDTLWRDPDFLSERTSNCVTNGTH